MPDVILNKSAVQPHHPTGDADADRRASSYFSHIKQWSNRDANGQYIPPTKSQFKRFMSRHVKENMIVLHGGDYEELVNNLRRLPIESIFNWGRMNVHLTYAANTPTRQVASRGQLSEGTQGLNFLLICFNVYAAIRAHHPDSSTYRPVPHSKVDFIWVSNACSQEEHFHGRNVFKMTPQMIQSLLECAIGTTAGNNRLANLENFWDNIIQCYNQIAQVHTIIDEDRRSPRRYRARVRRRNSGLNRSRVSTPARVRQTTISDGHLSAEYLNRSDEETGIPASHVAGMLLRVNLEQKVIDQIHEILITAIVSTEEIRRR